MRNTLKAVLVIAVVFPALSHALMGAVHRDVPTVKALRNLAAVAVAPPLHPVPVAARPDRYPSGGAAFQTCASCHDVLGIHNPAVELCTTCHSK